MHSGTCWPRSKSFIFMSSNVYLQKQHFMFHIKKKIQLICNATPVQLKVYNIQNMNNGTWPAKQKITPYLHGIWRLTYVYVNRQVL